MYLHPNQGRLQVRCEERDQLLLSELPSLQQHLAVIAKSHQVNGRLAEDRASLPNESAYR